MFTSPTVLLIEDDPPIATEIARVLSSTGGTHCTVWQAESALEARSVLRQGRPDLILLDLTLPDVDGLVFCTQLKSEAPNVPFMVCSQATTAEKVLAFKLGAEDVITKPFDLAELEVRVDAVLRRNTRPVSAPVSAERQMPTAPPPAPTQLGALRVDLARWRVTLDDRPLDLTPTEFQLLVFMTRRPGEILSREELARSVWGNASMSRSRTIDAYVRRISAKLSGSAAPRILSIRGLGYQLAAPLVTAA